jgi:restriction system protein
VFRRYQNQLTRAERGRLDNSIDNALFKIDRYLLRLDPTETAIHEAEVRDLREAIREGRERVERQYRQARRADLKLAQLSALTPESFEEFVAEMFEALGYEVEPVGGTGDEGADVRLRGRDGLLAVVQCKYHKRGVVGSPELQKFLGTIHHTLSHKGYFVTTSTFSLAAEKFAAEHPIELVDGPRLIELVNQALGPKGRRETEPAWF